MTDPKFARETDNGRYYIDPLDGVLVPSVTNVISEWAIPALAPGAAKETAEHILDTLPAALRAVRAGGAEREAYRKDASSHYEAVWERRRDLGSRVHHLAYARVVGKPVDPDPEAEPFVEQYLDFLATYGVDIDTDIEAAEITVMYRDQPRYAGTADLWARLRFDAEYTPQHPRWKGRKYCDPVPTPSGLWLIDIKTSVTKPPSTVYRDHKMQLAGLRHAQVAILPDDSWVPVPEFVGTAILNLREDSWALVPIFPTDEAAHLAFLSLVGVALYAHQIEMGPCKPVANPRPRLHLVKGA